MSESRILAIIGGMGSVAAADTFARLVELQSGLKDQEYLEVFLHNNTRIPDRNQCILHGGPSPLPELLRSVELCNRCEADTIILACMTAHFVLPRLQEASRAVIIDGVRETAAEVKRRLPEVQRVGILATAGNLACGLFQSALAEHGVDAVVFDDADQQYFFRDPIFEPWGIKAGHVSGRPKERFLAAVDRLRELGAEAIIGGCSEVPLVLNPDELDVPFISAIDCLCLAAIARCRRPVT